MNIKFLILIVLYILMLFSNSCKKKQSIQNNGNATATLNGKPWTGILQAKNNERFSFSIIIYKEFDGILLPFDGLGFGLVNKNIKVQKLSIRDSMVNLNPLLAKTYSSFSTSQGDGDVLCDMYEVLESDSLNNWIKIETEKNNFTEMSGIFNVTLLRIRTCGSSLYSDTLKFTNGHFNIKF
jgi:hypothetical protein